MRWACVPPCWLADPSGVLFSSALLHAHLLQVPHHGHSVLRPLGLLAGTALKSTHIHWIGSPGPGKTREEEFSEEAGEAVLASAGMARHANQPPLAYTAIPFHALFPHGILTQGCHLLTSAQGVLLPVAPYGVLPGPSTVSGAPLPLLGSPAFQPPCSCQDAWGWASIPRMETYVSCDGPGRSWGKVGFRPPHLASSLLPCSFLCAKASILLHNLTPIFVCVYTCIYVWTCTDFSL